MNEGEEFLVGGEPTYTPPNIKVRMGDKQGTSRLQNIQLAVRGLNRLAKMDIYDDPHDLGASSWAGRHLQVPRTVR